MTPNSIHISTVFCVHELISKGLPPPPKASGLLLAVCSALLVSTVALPSLTAVLIKAGSIVVDLAPEDAEIGFGLVEEVDRVCETEERAVDTDVDVGMVKLILVVERILVGALNAVVWKRVTVVVETGVVDEAKGDECIDVMGFVGLLVDRG